MDREMLNIIRRHATKATMKVDSAVLQLLQLEADTTSVSSAGGGGCSSASTSKIVSKLKDGTEKTFFMKTGSGNAAEVMFEGNIPPSPTQSKRSIADSPSKASMHRSTPSMLLSRPYAHNPTVMENSSPTHRSRFW
jgi:hypothetical protein